MMKKLLVLTVAAALMAASVLLLTNLTPSAAAFQGPPQMGPGGPGGPGGGPGFGGPAHRRHRGMLSLRMFERLADRLQLSDQQLEQIGALFDAHRDTVGPIHQQLRELHVQIQDLTADGGFFENENTITDLAQQAAQMQSQLHVERARLRAEIYQVLTPEQREQLQQMKGRFRGGRRGGFGK